MTPDTDGEIPYCHETIKVLTYVDLEVASQSTMLSGKRIVLKFENGTDACEKSESMTLNNIVIDQKDTRKNTL